MSERDLKIWSSRISTPLCLLCGVLAIVAGYQWWPLVLGIAGGIGVAQIVADIRSPGWDDHPHSPSP